MHRRSAQEKRQLQKQNEAGGTLKEEVKNQGDMLDTPLLANSQHRQAGVHPGVFQPVGQNEQQRFFNDVVKLRNHLDAFLTEWAAPTRLNHNPSEESNEEESQLTIDETK